MKQKILYYILLIPLLIGSCNSPEDDSIPPAPDSTPQTTLMYMTGTDLSSFFSSNITAAKKAIVSDALGYGRFVVFRHSTSSTATLVEYKYEAGTCTETTLEEYSNIISLSQDAITTVVADLKRHAPADSYNLIISGHATGWVPKTRLTTTWSAPAASSAQDVIDWEAMYTSPIVTRYLGSTNDSFFDIDELQASLEATDTHFGCILFDECFMASIEAIYPLRYLCDYVIASPCEIMGAGFPYDTVLPELFAASGQEPNLQGVCQAFYDYYSIYTYPSGCVSMAVTEHLDALATITTQINASQTNTVDLSEIQPYERLADHVFYDFEHYMLALCGDEALSAEFLELMEAAFPSECRLHTDRFFANIGVSASSSNNYEAYFTPINYYSGVTTSAPSSQMSEEWAETAWSKIIK